MQPSNKPSLVFQTAMRARLRFARTTGKSSRAFASTPPTPVRIYATRPEPTVRRTDLARVWSRRFVCRAVSLENHFSFSRLAVSAKSALQFGDQTLKWPSPFLAGQANGNLSAYSSCNRTTGEMRSGTRMSLSDRFWHRALLGDVRSRPRLCKNRNVAELSPVHFCHVRNFRRQIFAVAPK